jgi:hypothetical protein
MKAPETTRTRPFGIGTRTEIRLDECSLLTLSVRAGDLLRSGGGTVWATADGEPDDILLEPGDVHVVPRDGQLPVSAIGHARLEIYGCGPLRYVLPQPRTSASTLAPRAKGLWRWGWTSPGRLA